MASTIPTQSLPYVTANQAMARAYQQAAKAKAQRQFWSVDFPSSLVAGATTYGLFTQNDKQSRAIRKLGNLMTEQKNLTCLLDQATQPGFLQTNTGTAFGYETLRRLRNLITEAAEPVEIRQVLRELEPRIHDGALLKQVSQQTQRYTNTYHSLLQEQALMQELAKLPALQGLLKRSPSQLKLLVGREPRKFLQTLFETTRMMPEEMGQHFLKQLLERLGELNGLRAFRAGRAVALGLMIMFWEKTHIRTKKANVLQ